MLLKDQHEYWEKYYAQGRAEQCPSLFADFVLSRFPDHRVIIDVGCGSGRDSFLFASRSWRVYGLDASRTALARARERCSTFSERCDFIEFDAGKQKIDEFVDVATLPIERTLIYARFFIHAISEGAEALFLDAAAMLVTRGATLCIECRTLDDAKLPKAESEHYRRFIDPDELKRRCRSRGMQEVYSHVGRGLSPYGMEDPILFRIIMKSVYQ